MHKHSSRPTPEGVILLHLWHPPSEQFSIPNGVPLYPVETILMSFTITHPTDLFIQFDLLATISVLLRIYVSHLGLTRSWLTKLNSKLNMA